MGRGKQKISCYWHTGLELLLVDLINLPHGDVTEISGGFSISKADVGKTIKQVKMHKDYQNAYSEPARTSWQMSSLTFSTSP